MKEGFDKTLWVPGQKLEYENYTAEHLLEDWSRIYAENDTRVLSSVDGGILGALHLPEHAPSMVASIDLCDVLRETHLATARVLGKNREHIGNDIWIYTPTLGLEKDTAPEIVKAVMNADLVDPVGEIESIRNIMHRWKQQGVYVVANTSTLPNCERATIENFLARELPDCFDGIVLPRNHYGDGSVTKGDALQAVVSTIAGSQEAKVEKAVHIDDAPHHIRDVDEVLGNVATKGIAIMPVYEPGSLARRLDPVEIGSSAVKALSPLGAFKEANYFLLDEE